MKLADTMSLKTMPAPAMIAIVGIFGPIAEELVFRGMVFRTLRKGFPFAVAALLSGICFCIYHMNWVQGCYAGAAGLIFGWVFVTTGKLRYTILLHFAFNAGSYLMGLLWFVNTPFDVAITVAIAGVILVEAMRSLRQACQQSAVSTSTAFPH